MNPYHREKGWHRIISLILLERNQVRTKDEFLKLVQDIRAKLDAGVEAKCSCPKIKCEWHSDCYNCVRIHRHFGDHIPNCLTFILQDKITEIARVVELNVNPKEKTPAEYYDYVKQISPPKPRP
jgi:hypothetical protein